VRFTSKIPNSYLRPNESDDFASGRRRKREFLLSMLRLGIDLLAGHRQTIEEALAADHQAILDAYVARKQRAAPAIRRSPVFAPPELLDDDSTGQG